MITHKGLAIVCRSFWPLHWAPSFSSFGCTPARVSKAKQSKGKCLSRGQADHQVPHRSFLAQVVPHHSRADHKTKLPIFRRRSSTSLFPVLWRETSMSISKFAEGTGKFSHLPCVGVGWRSGADEGDLGGSSGVAEGTELTTCSGVCQKTQLCMSRLSWSWAVGTRTPEGVASEARHPLR